MRCTFVHSGIFIGSCLRVRKTKRKGFVTRFPFTTLKLYEPSSKYLPLKIESQAYTFRRGVYYLSADVYTRFSSSEKNLNSEEIEMHH